MAVKITSATFTGIEGVMVDVEVEVSKGLPNFNIVGLGDMAVKESKERVRSAITNSGFEFPIAKITVNLAPADIKKEGAIFDLPIAVGILMATDQIVCKNVEKFLFMGELSLNGELRFVRGAFPIVIEGMERGILNFILPIENGKECLVLKEVNSYPFEDLKQVTHFLRFEDSLPYNIETQEEVENCTLDFQDIVGQGSAKRALEVAAAGGHNVLMFGPPGSGKTLLASRFSTILPQLTYEEALEVTKIYSVSGHLDKEKKLIKKRPFRNPHHTISKVALIGGGNELKVGEITLAHNGVLFLDEILEFKKNVLEVLRQPLEERIIKISRANGTVVYPANFILIGALNPCPCGFYLSQSAIKNCTCSERERSRYIGRLSGPLLDRMDIFSFVPQLNYSEISKNIKSERSKDIRIRVELAREKQNQRFKGSEVRCNAEMNKEFIDEYCALDIGSQDIMKSIYEKYGLSTRAYYRILKVARTIADLNDRKDIDKSDIIEAIQYRKFLNKEII